MSEWGDGGNPSDELVRQLLEAMRAPFPAYEDSPTKGDRT